MEFCSSSWLSRILLSICTTSSLSKKGGMLPHHSSIQLLQKTFAEHLSALRQLLSRVVISTPRFTPVELIFFMGGQAENQTHLFIRHLILLQTGVHLKTFPLDGPGGRGGVTGEECNFLQHLLGYLMLILRQYHFISPLSLSLKAHSLLGDRGHPCLHKSFCFSCSSVFFCNRSVSSLFSL